MACVALLGTLSATAAGAAMRAAEDADGAAGVDPTLVAEMTVEGMSPRACEGIASIDTLTEAPGAERADTPEAQALREVFAEDPTGGLSPQSPRGWVLLRRDNDGVTFGQRTGDVGIGATVDLQLQGDRYVWTGSGGCGPVGYADGRTAEKLRSFFADGTELQVRFTGDTCGSATHSVVVHETARNVDVLLIRSPSHGGGWCGGEAETRTITVVLEHPVGDRAVRDISNLPAETLDPHV